MPRLAALLPVLLLAFTAAASPAQTLADDAFPAPASTRFT